MFSEVNCGGDPTRLGDLDPAREDELPSVSRIPKYVALTVLNGWKPWVSSKRSHHLFTLESGGHVSIVQYPKIDLSPINLGHLQVSQAVALSGAAIAYRMGDIDNEKYRFWQIQVGFGLFEWVSTRPHEFWGQIFVWICNILFLGVSIAISILPLPPHILFIFFGACALLAIAELLRPSKYIQWILDFSFIQHMYQLFGIDMLGGSPLPSKVILISSLNTTQISLSDGAHGDNLGLLPLLEKRCYSTILVCDGGEDPHEMCLNLLESLPKAREKLQCSFISNTDQADVEGEIRAFANSNDLCYRFSVVYPPGGMISTSEICYIKPRKAFAKAPASQNRRHRIFEYFCGVFPHEATHNEFFTSAQFRQYDDFGYETASTIYAFPDLESLNSPATK